MRGNHGTQSEQCVIGKEYSAETVDSVFFVFSGGLVLVDLPGNIELGHFHGITTCLSDVSWRVSVRFSNATELDYAYPLVIYKT